MVNHLFLAQKSAYELADSIRRLRGNILDSAEVLARECSFSRLHSLELHNLRSNVLALQLHKLLLNKELGVFLSLLTVEYALLSQFLSDILSIDEFLFLLSLEDLLVNFSDFAHLVDFFKSNLSAVFSLLDKDIELVFDFVLLLLELHNFFIVKIDLFFDLQINFITVVVVDCSVFLDQAIKFSCFFSLFNFNF